MKEKTKNFLSNNKYLLISFFFMYIVPLVLLVVLAGQSKSKVVGLKLWGSIVGFIIIIIYFAKFRKWIDNKKQLEKVEQLRVPVYIRVIQMFISLLCFVVVYLLVSTTDKMFEEVLVFILCCCLSVMLGHLFLIKDSRKRVPHKLTRD